jgi:hypothetical protein
LSAFFAFSAHGFWPAVPPSPPASGFAGQLRRTRRRDKGAGGQPEFRVWLGRLGMVGEALRGVRREGKSRVGTGSEAGLANVGSHGRFLRSANAPYLSPLHGFSVQPSYFSISPKSRASSHWSPAFAGKLPPSLKSSFRLRLPASGFAGQLRRTRRRTRCRTRRRGKPGSHRSGGARRGRC